MGAILFDLLVLFLLLMIPMVQTFVAKQVANYLSDELKAKVTIEKISISPSLVINLDKVYISDQHFNPMIESEKINISIASLSVINQKLNIGTIALSSPKFSLKKYASESTLNLDFFIKYFNSTDTISKPNKWVVSAKKVKLDGACFSYDNYHKLHLINKKQIDFNHLKISKVNADFSKFSLIKDSLKVKINNLSLIDSSGFWIKKLSGDFLFAKGFMEMKMMELKTPNSVIFANLSMLFKDPDNFKDFANSVELKAQILDAKINTKDLSYFIPKNPLPNSIFNLKTSMDGRINDFNIHQLFLKYGKNSSLALKGRVKNITHKDLVDINAPMIEFNTSLEDVQALNIGKFVIPAQLNSISKLKATANFNGTLHNFKSLVTLNTSAGDAESNIVYTTKNGVANYEVIFISNGFDVSKIAPNSGLRKIALNTEIKGTGLDSKTIDVSISGNIKYIEYKDYVFENTKIDGKYSKKVFFGHVLVNDPMLWLDFNGTVDYSALIPSYQFFADVDHANLSALKIVDRDPNSVLSTHMNASITGDKFDDFVGQIIFFDTKYYENERWYSIDNIDVVSEYDKIGYRSISVKSDWVDMNVNGKYKFSDLTSSFNFILKKYLPSYAPQKSLISDLVTITNKSKKTTINPVSEQKTERRFLSFDINIKDSDPITSLFVPKLHAKGNTTLKGFFNTITQHVDFYMNSDSLQVGSLNFTGISLQGVSKDSLLNIQVECKEFVWSKKDTFLFSNIKLQSSLKNDSLFYSLGWNSNNNFDQLSSLNGQLVFGKSPILRGNISSANIYANDSIWHIDPNNYFFLDKKEFDVSNLRCFSGEKQLIIDGAASKDPNDILTVKLVNFNVSEADTWANNRSFDLDGIVNGEVELSRIFDKFSIIVNFKVLDLGVNGHKLGNANVVSAWDERKNGLFVNIDAIYRGNKGENKPVTIQGYFYPKGQKLEMDAEIVNLKLAIIEPYLKNIFYRVDGLATGSLKIIGTINHPQITGKIKLMRTVIGVNYLNTEYTLNQEIEMQQNRIIFDSVVAIDGRFQTGVINGWVSHEDFKNFKLDVSIKMLNLMGMNTTRSMNEMFYGKGFGTGMVRIYGAAPNIKIDAQVETNENTDISVPINFNTVVDKSSYINFVSVQQREEVETKNLFIDLGLSMNFLFNITPEAKFHVFLDPSTGGSLHGSGTGSIRMNVNTKGDFNMYGTFVVSKGQYEMKLKDVVNKTFKIEEGGTVLWNGDPSDAEIDIKAKYPVLTSISSLLASDSSNSSSYNRKINVLSVVKLTGKLLNPTVKFAIELPNVDNTTSSMIFNAIDTTNDQNMIRQTFSLLVLNQFEPTISNQNSNVVGNGLGMSTMELLSNQVSNYISQKIKDLNLSFSYKTADQVTTEEYQVAITKAFLNDRLVIEGSMSAGGQSKAYQNPNSVVGDIIVEAKLTPDGKWRTKVYNIANTNVYTYQNAPYVQGIGFVYRVNFNKLSDLFFKNKK